MHATLGVLTTHDPAGGKPGNGGVVVGEVPGTPGTVVGAGGGNSVDDGAGVPVGSGGSGGDDAVGTAVTLGVAAGGATSVVGVGEGAGAGDGAGAALEQAQRETRISDATLRRICIPASSAFHAPLPDVASPAQITPNRTRGNWPLRIARPRRIDHPCDDLIALDWYHGRYHTSSVAKAQKRIEAARNNPSGVRFDQLGAILRSVGFRLARTSGSQGEALSGETSARHHRQVFIGGRVMEPFRYRIITEWSDEDDAFIARIPALPGCSAHGESEEEAAREVRAAADAVLEVMRDEKRPIPSADTTADYSGNIRLRLPPTLHRRLAELATAEETSLNALMVAALTAFIERPFRPPQTESFRIAEDVRRYAHSHFILPDLKLPAADQKKLACTMHTPRTKRVWLKAAISPRSRHLLRNAGYEIRDAAELRSDAMPSLAGKKSGKRKGA